ncbi:hypothetical protein G6N82_01630 [Altererythrobacter sp. BO-6]|uniref:hypothetical protein n=1 Tax=Altererythrobacter sp. BO-6 TaxID=2604537 RepID=UPI0013E13B24|nr:hypothetical protein [Altererythrobacter sp. BO-6]QIG53032.1 hypothetical protein G6N82_01630 [Altererythrobacter sp. BO-6]
MNASAEDPAEVFRVSMRTRILLPLAVSVFGIIPLGSLYLAFGTGSFEISAGSSGWKGTPVWLILTLCWLAFLWFLFVFARMLKYYRRPQMFTLSKGEIEIGGERVPKSQIMEIRGRGLFGDTIVLSKAGTFTIHPQLTRGGIGALHRHFRRRYDAKAFAEVPWLVGK